MAPRLDRRSVGSCRPTAQHPNSLRGEAVPEQGAMHGSAIQVSSQITSPQPMPDDMCTIQRFVFCQHWSEAVGGRYHLWGVGRIYPTPRSPMTGTARVKPPTILEGTEETPLLQPVCGLNCGLFLSKPPISFVGEAHKFLWALMRWTDGVISGHKSNLGKYFAKQLQP